MMNICYWVDDIDQMLWSEIKLFCISLKLAGINHNVIDISDIDKVDNVIYLINLSNSLVIKKCYPALINERVINLVKEEKVKLLFVYLHENNCLTPLVNGIRYGIQSYRDFLMIDFINTLIDEFYIPHNMVYLLANSPEPIYKNVKQSINILPFNLSFKYMILSNNTSQYIQADEVDNTLRDYRFISLNHMERNHRDLLMNFLFENDLLSLGKISYSQPGLNALPKLADKTPFVVDGIFDRHRQYGQYDNFDYLYRDVYFSIVTETMFNQDTQFITEKTLMPMLQLCPTIILAPCGHLEQLKKLGFKTFHPYINETYDGVQHNNRRLQVIFREITRLCSMTDTEINNWYHSMMPILIHNQKHLLNNHDEINNAIRQILKG